MRKGFTLIELIIVLTVIGIISTIGYQFYSKIMAKAKAAQLVSQLKQIQTGLAKYYKDLGTFPYYLDYLIVKPSKPGDGDTVDVGKGGWDSFSAAMGAADDPELIDYWGGPYLDGMKVSPDVQHCLLSTLGGPICFGATYNTADVNATQPQVFSNIGPMINYPFSGDDGQTIAEGTKSHGYDSTSTAFYNVLQVANVPKDIAVNIYKDMNGGREPLPLGNLVQASLGDAPGGDPTMFVGVPALTKYSQYNRIVYRYFRLY